MDTSVKTLVSVVITFIGLLLLVTCLSFFILASNARDTLYSAINYIEVYGYNQSVIDDYAASKNTTIEVMTLASAEGTRYEVKVSFDHVFAFINLNKHFSYTATSRVVET